jgi:hypothetical protein
MPIGGFSMLVGWLSLIFAWFYKISKKYNYTYNKLTNFDKFYHNLTPTNFPNGSLPSPEHFPTKDPLHNGHVGLLAFQAEIHCEWKYFLQVEQSSSAYSYLFI